MKHIEKALQIANEERARLRDRLRVIDTNLQEHTETRMQRAIRRARDDARNVEAAQPAAQAAAANEAVSAAQVAAAKQAASAAQVAAAKQAASAARAAVAKQAASVSQAAPSKVPAAATPPDPNAATRELPVLTARLDPRRNGGRVPQPTPPRRTPPLDLTSIVYSETRVLDVPRSALEAKRIVAGDGEDAVTRAYKLLRTQVLHRMRQKNWQTLAIVSPGASEGKTLTAINLGVAMAGSVQHSVMLVDCDWRRPSVHKYFEYTPEYDIETYLSGRVSMSKAIVNPGIARFCFLPCRAPLSHSSERLGSAAVANLVSELRDKYLNRIVLFDLPPMLLTDDALSFLPHVDCVLVVVEENRTRHDELEQTLELIGRDKLVGTVLNKSSLRRAGY